MRTVNIHDAKTHFSRLVDAASNGEVILIAKAGTPVAKLTRLDAPSGTQRRTGFLEGEAEVPDDFDSLMQDEIAELFESSDSEHEE